VTDHTAQGRTVHTGLAVITGTEDRQHAYVALTRGTDDNTAYVFTQSPKQAGPLPGPRPAPELDRYDRRNTSAATPSLPTARSSDAQRRHEPGEPVIAAADRQREDEGKADDSVTQTADRLDYSSCEPGGAAEADGSAAADWVGWAGPFSSALRGRSPRQASAD
jgi:hypothetical protein